MNRAMRRALRAPDLRVVDVTEHCVDCGAPYCPTCDEHMSRCPECGDFHCDTCGLQLVARVADASSVN